jgi:hypothetical protein
MFDINLLIRTITNKTTTYLTDVVDKCQTVYNITTVVKLYPNPDRYVVLDDFHLIIRAHGLIEPSSIFWSLKSFHFPR